MNAPPVNFIWILTIGSLIPPGAAQAEIYRWTDADGNSHFSDQAPARTEVETLRLTPINTYTVPEVLAAPTDPAEAGNRPRVVMYSASWCGLCKRARRYFRENGIRFTEYDVEKSPKGGRDFARLGGRGVPVILVGKSRMNGFSEATFESLYLKLNQDARCRGAYATSQIPPRKRHNRSWRRGQAIPYASDNRVNNRSIPKENRQ